MTNIKKNLTNTGSVNCPQKLIILHSLRESYYITYLALMIDKETKK